MAVATWGYGDSDDEFMEGEERATGGVKNALLVVIDASPAMFQEWKTGEDVPFRAAIKCCQAIWRSKVVSSGKDVVSLVFFGTEQSKNSLNFANIYQLQELSTVKVAMIEELNRMKNSEDFDEFESKIGSSDRYDLKDLFWLTKIIIDEGEATSYQKKMIFFTCNDSPHAGKSNMQREAVKKFKDMGKMDMSIVAFNDEFSLENFYSQIVEDESNIIRADNLDDLMKVVRVKQRMKRTISRTTLDLGEGVKIGVGFYSFIRPARKPQHVRINKRTTEELQRTVNEFRTETGMPVLKSEERKMVQIQGEQAIFTKEEIKQVKQVHERGVQLIGFLNGDSFASNQNGNSENENKGFNHFTWYRSPGYFLYPDEERITGSRDLFTALLKRCHILNKIILVKMVLSRGRSPKLACLIPSVETDNALFPQGFHIFPVPFSDEIRSYDFDFGKEAPPNLVSSMEKVIKKITNKGFDVLDVYNPVIQYHWRELERIALDLAEDELDEFSDLTEPNEALMEQRLGDLPELIENDEQLPAAFTTQKSSASIVNVNMAMEVKHKRVDKLTVAILKDFLISKRAGPPTDINKKRKADLVTAVYKYFEENGDDDV